MKSKAVSIKALLHAIHIFHNKAIIEVFQVRQQNFTQFRHINAFFDQANFIKTVIFSKS